jgi:hypothetical protein
MLSYLCGTNYGFCCTPADALLQARSYGEFPISWIYDIGLHGSSPLSWRRTKDLGHFSSLQLLIGNQSQMLGYQSERVLTFLSNFFSTFFMFFFVLHD